MYILTIYSPSNEFVKHIPDIFPRELQLKKSKYFRQKKNPFLDLNIKVIVNDVKNSVYDKHDDLRFPIINFPWLSGDVPGLPS